MTPLVRAGLVVAGLVVGTALADAARADERYVPTARGTRPAVARWRPLLAQYPWNVDTALRVLDCESGGDPDAVNAWSGAAGLFQLYRWERLAEELTGSRDVLDPEVNARVAYVLWLAGGRRFDTSIGWHASAECWGW